MFWGFFEPKKYVWNIEREKNPRRCERWLANLAVSNCFILRENYMSKLQIHGYIRLVVRAVQIFWSKTISKPLNY